MSFSRTPAVIAASLALLGGCGGAAVLATDAMASTPPAHAASASAQTPGTDSGAAHDASSGTATVSLTGPKGKTRTRTVPVSCRMVDGDYVLASGRQLSHGSIGFSLEVTGDSGPGSYNATATFVHRGRYGFHSRHLPNVPVTLTSDGGSFSWSKTLTGKRAPALAGKTVSASASWTCSV